MKKCFGGTVQPKPTDDQHAVAADVDRDAGGGDDDDATEQTEEMADGAAAARTQVKESRGVTTRAAYKRAKSVAKGSDRPEGGDNDGWIEMQKKLLPERGAKALGSSGLRQFD